MECLEFRRAAGAEPGRLSGEAQAHADACPACAAHLRQLRELDASILKALQVPLPQAQARMDATTAPAGMVQARTPRQRWYAMAASIVAGVLIGTLLWVGGPDETVARSLVEHLAHEPGALVTTEAPADAERLDKVLSRAGISLRPEIGTVSYARSCPFRGERVPHLVVQSDSGPVTVMVLRNEKLDAPVSFNEDGYSGRIVPAGPGSIAVIGGGGTDLEQVTERVLAAVKWNND
jgi:hypothetical protein